MVDWTGPSTTGFRAAACARTKLSSRLKFASQLLNTHPFTCTYHASELACACLGRQKTEQATEDRRQNRRQKTEDGGGFTVSLYMPISAPACRQEEDAHTHTSGGRRAAVGTKNRVMGATAEARGPTHRKGVINRSRNKMGGRPGPRPASRKPGRWRAPPPGLAPACQQPHCDTGARCSPRRYRAGRQRREG